MIPTEINLKLKQLNRRLLGIHLIQNISVILLSLSSLFVFFFLLDYLLEPPFLIRLTNGALSLLILIGICKKQFQKYPITKKGELELGLIYEKHHSLDDRLITAIELAQKEPEPSTKSFAKEVIKSAIHDCKKITAKQCVPSRLAKKQFITALLITLLCLTGITNYPGYNKIFWQRLFQANVLWPSGTSLIFDFSQINQEAHKVTSSKENHYEIKTAQPENLDIRVQAKGDIPQEVMLIGLGRPQKMRSLSGGYFSLKLPPLYGEKILTLSGGDHIPNKTSLKVIPGNAPKIINWETTIIPPPYTGLPSSTTKNRELRIIEGSELAFRFDLQNTKDDIRVSLTSKNKETKDNISYKKNNSEIQLSLIATKDQSLNIEITNSEGFQKQYKNHIKWDTNADLKPEIETLFPTKKFHVFESGLLPISANVKDDFGIKRIAILSKEKEIKITERPNSLSEKIFFTFPVKEIKSDGTMFIDIVCEDNSPSQENSSTITSGSFEILGKNEWEKYQISQIQGMRRKLETVHNELDLIAKDLDSYQFFEIERIITTIKNLCRKSEYLLCEQVFSLQDNNEQTCLESLESLLKSKNFSGKITGAFKKGQRVLVYGKSKELWELTNALFRLYNRNSPTILNPETTETDLINYLVQLKDEVDIILNSLSTWEDYQSTLYLLRELLERQRGIYLKTQELAK